MNRDTDRMIEWFCSRDWGRNFEGPDEIEEMLDETGFSPADSGIVVDHDYVDYAAVYDNWVNTIGFDQQS